MKKQLTKILSEINWGGNTIQPGQVVTYKDFPPFKTPKQISEEQPTIAEADAPGEWVAFVEYEGSMRKKLLKVLNSGRGAKMWMSKNSHKLLDDIKVRSVGTMTKKEWDKVEAKHAIKEFTETATTYVNEATEGDKMKHKYLDDVSIELISTTNKGWKVKQTGDGTKRGKGKTKTAYFDDQDISGEKSLFVKE
jgi:hypothetical protein